MAIRYPLVAALQSGDLYTAEELPVGDWATEFYEISQGNLPVAPEPNAVGWCTVDPQEWFFYDRHFAAWLSFRTEIRQFVAHSAGGRATQTLAGTTNFADGDTVRVGPAGLTYTAKTALGAGAASERQFKIGGTLALSLQALAACINGSGMAGDSTIALAQYGYASPGSHLVVAFHVVGATTMDILSLIPGAQGVATIVSVGAGNTSDCVWLTETGTLAKGSLGSLLFGGGNFVPGTELFIPGGLAGFGGGAPYMGYYFPAGKWALYSLRAKCNTAPKTGAGADASWSLAFFTDGTQQGGDITQATVGATTLAKEFVSALTVWDGDKAVHMKAGGTGSYARLPAGMNIEVGIKRVLT